MARHRAPWQQTWLLRQRWTYLLVQTSKLAPGCGAACQCEGAKGFAALAPRGACCNYSSADMSPDIEAGQKKRVRVRPQKANKAAGGSPATTPAGAHASATPPGYCTNAPYWGRADACCTRITRSSLPGKPLAAQEAKTPQATQQPKASQQQASAKKRVRARRAASRLFWVAASACQSLCMACMCTPSAWRLCMCMCSTHWPTVARWACACSLSIA